MKVIRKTISLLLAGVLLFSMLPTVLAEEIIIQDKISGASYMLPDSWTIDSTVDNNKEFRITCTTETDGYFYCSSMDTWASLDEQSKAAYSNNRSNVNNTIFTPRLIAQLFGWEPDKVSLEDYGNHSFFVYDRSEKISGRDYRWTSLLTYWNGYFTNISLVVPPYDIVSMAELKKCLDSFTYPGEEPAEKPTDAASWTCTSCGTENSGNFCSECGAPKPDVKQWTCPNCQTENEGNFCSECGTKKP